VPELHPSVIAAGPGHPRVRQYLDLKLNRRREEAGRVALEGMWLLRAAAERAVPLDAVLVCAELLRGPLARDLVRRLQVDGVPVFGVSPRTFGRLTNRDGPDGLLAIAEYRGSNLDDLTVPRVSRVLVLDRFELAGNIGSLIRCADAVGATAVILVDSPVRLAHPVLLKASMGAVFSVPVCRATPGAALDWLRRLDFRLAGADPASPLSYRALQYDPRTAVVIGSERRGLSSFWRDSADELVSVPLLGRSDSLNAGHAGAVVLYEVLHRQEAGRPRRGGPVTT
jgi:RNA methyltransferase, TrmH family